jgi:RNA polymerase sporulation-specific sigma factor
LTNSHRKRGGEYLAKKNLLSHEETMKLIAEAQEGSKEAKEKLVKSNTRLIWNIVQRYRHRGYDIDDIFQIGAIGLLKGIDKFDASYNVRFSTYAVPMIIGEIQRFLRDDGAIKVARPLKDVAAKIKRWDLFGETPERINEVLELDNIQLVKDTLQYIKQGAVKSMDETVYAGKDGSDEITLADQLSDDVNGDNWFEHIALKSALEHLTTREKRIVDLRYYQDRTQSEVAKELGISQVQVSRLEKKILHTMKGLMEEKDGMRKPRGDREKAIELLKTTSMTLQEISDESGVPLGSLAPLSKIYRPKEVREKNQVRGQKAPKPKKKKEEKEVKNQHVYVDNDEIVVQDVDVDTGNATEVFRVKDRVAAPLAVSVHPGTDTRRMQTAEPNVAAAPKSDEPTVKPSVDFGFNIGVEGDGVDKSEALASITQIMSMIRIAPTDKVSFTLKVSQ